MKTKLKILGVAAASLLLAAPALAEGGKYGETQNKLRQEQNVGQQQMQQNQSRARMDDKRQKGDKQQVNKRNIRRNISAEVVDTRIITLRNKQGKQEKHVVAKVKLTKGSQTGSSVVLDLGKQQDLERAGIDIQNGVTFDAEGVPGRINNRQVLAVTALSTEAGKTQQNRQNR